MSDGWLTKRIQNVHNFVHVQQQSHLIICQLRIVLHAICYATCTSYCCILHVPLIPLAFSSRLQPQSTYLSLFGLLLVLLLGAEFKKPGTRAIHLNTLSSLVMHNSSAMPHRNSKRQMPHIIVNWYFFFWLRSYLSCSTYQTFAHLLSSFLWSILQSMYAWYPANKLNCNRPILASVRYSYWICIQRNDLIIGSIEIENAIG